MTRPSWTVDLERDGYVVVPDVIAKSACDTFQDAALTWLEGFPASTGTTGQPGRGRDNAGFAIGGSSLAVGVRYGCHIEDVLLRIKSLAWDGELVCIAFPTTISATAGPAALSVRFGISPPASSLTLPYDDLTMASHDDGEEGVGGSFEQDVPLLPVSEYPAEETSTNDKLPLKPVACLLLQHLSK